MEKSISSFHHHQLEKSFTISPSQNGKEHFTISGPDPQKQPTEFLEENGKLHVPDNPDQDPSLSDSSSKKKKIYNKKKRRKHRKYDSSEPSSSDNFDSSDCSDYRRKQRKKKSHH